MGLIKAALNAGSTVLADQWKEYFYCDALPIDVLCTKGQKRTTAGTSNTKASDNVISNGSTIAVADGQCMIIVENGKVVEVAAEPGLFTFDSSTEPSIFAGNFGKSLIDSFKTFGKRFSYGGDTGTDQRVYYFNTKEITDNLFGTSEAIPFNTYVKDINLRLQTSLRINGRYTYKITNPLLFYTNVCGNVETAYRKSQLDAQLKTEFVSALAPCIAQVSQLGVLPSDVPLHQKEITKSMNAELDDQWANLRGIEVISIAFNPITIPPKDNEIIQKAQQTAFLSNPTMAAGRLVEAQANAMEAAASNEATGPMMAFAGMNMAQMTGGMNANSLFAMGQQQAPQAPAQPAGAVVGAAAPAGWACSCGTAGNTGKFCMNCGQARPVPSEGWTCACGAVNQGKFCQECGAKKPAGAPLYKCDKCGWTPEDPTNPPKFCPECGDVFDDNDVQK